MFVLCPSVEKEEMLRKEAGECLASTPALACDLRLPSSHRHFHCDPPHPHAWPCCLAVHCELFGGSVNNDAIQTSLNHRFERADYSAAILATIEVSFGVGLPAGRAGHRRCRRSVRSACCAPPVLP